MVVEGIYVNGVVKLNAGHDLTEGTRVRVVRSHPSREETLADLRASHAEAVAGVGQPLHEAMDDISAELGLPPSRPARS